MTMVGRGKLAGDPSVVLVSPQGEECATLLIYCWVTRQILAQVTNEREWDCFLKSQLQQRQEPLGTEEEERKEGELAAECSEKASAIVV